MTHSVYAQLGFIQIGGQRRGPMPARGPLSRRGFTLIEMLVVIAIIATLVGLLLPAVIDFLKKIPQTKTSSEISQLDQAIQSFRTTYNVGYIPSRIKLCEKFGQYQIIENGVPDVQLDRDSVTFLTTVFNHILASADPAKPNGPTLWKTTGIDWNNDGNSNSPPVTLEGDQCLVFFLGGVQTKNPPNCFGWATDSRNPVNASQIQGRKGPFFQFVGAHLALRPSQAGSAGYFSYYDPYSSSPPNPSVDKPYAYFSSYGLTGGVGYIQYGGSDCASLSVNPYCANNPGALPLQYYNSTSHQIISAGANQLFGPGGHWTPATAGAIGAAGLDDQCNFNSGNLLGVGN